MLLICLLGGLLATQPPSAQAQSQTYTFHNVVTGGGGGFVVDVIFNQKQKDLIYAKTDIGGVYRWNPSSSTWTQLLSWVGTDQWNMTGGEAVATDAVDPNRLYIAGGTYTNSYAPTNGVILRSTDQGNTFQITQMPFKMGGNMPGRGMGERLAVDPNKDSIIYFSARSGNGLWKSTDFGVTWSKVTKFPDTGPFAENPSDPSGYLSDPVGVTWVTFDPSTGTTGNPTQTIYVGVGENGSGKANIYRSTDAGATWAAIPGEPTCSQSGNIVTCTGGATWDRTKTGNGGSLDWNTGGYLPHQGKLDSQGTLYVTYSDWEGPYNGNVGDVWKFVPSTSTWTKISPVPGTDTSNDYFGYGGLGVDMLHPGSLVVAAVNSWWPDGRMYRSTDGGTTWKPAWTYTSYPSRSLSFSMDISNAPWLNFGNTNPVDPVPAVKLGWMMEGLNIDPFNSDRMMYGTGATLYATNNLTTWDSGGTMNIKSTAMGIEEASVLDLVSPPSGTAHLYSIIGDIGGFRHDDLTKSPLAMYSIPYAGTYNAIDFAESNPNFLVRVGTGNPNPGNGIQPYHGNAFTYDGGNNWFQGNADIVAGQGAGTVAAAADANRVLWAPNNAPVSYSTDNGNSWHASSGIPQGAVVASDRVNKNKFYGFGQGKFWMSTDGGATFTASATTGLPQAGDPVEVKAVFGHEGDVWLAGGKTGNAYGLWYSTDGGVTFTKLSNVTGAEHIGFGMVAPGQSYPALYAVAVVGGLHTIYRSDNGGMTWVQITDAQHMFATIQTITGDPRIYGRVYFGTNGLGAFYGDLAGPMSTATTTPTTGASATATRTGTATATRTSTQVVTATTGASATATRTSTATFTPIAGASFTPTRTSTSTVTPTQGVTFQPPTSLKVQVQNGGTDNTQQSQFHFLVVNTSTSAQTSISARLYIRLDNSQPVSKYVIEKYWDQSGVAAVSGPTLASGNIYFYTISYGAASLPSGSSWQYQGALHLSDWTNNFDAGNDWWHTGYAVGALPTAFTDTNFIPAYIGSTLVWGTTP